jgi:broad specificity phosphatase PhoE
VVAAHEGILRILVCTVLGLPVYGRFLLRIDTAGITEVEWDAGRSRWRLIRVNQSV